MEVRKTSLKGVYQVFLEAHEDNRGCFYETYNEAKYYDLGLNTKFIEDDISCNYKGVLKGMHGDAGTYKLVQVLYGEVYAVVLNCDELSKDFGKWESFVLSSKNRNQLFIPPKYGNGYMVISDIAVYSYKQSTYYGEYKQFTYKYNDSRFGIKWPAEASIISERDA